LVLRKPEDRSAEDLHLLDLVEQVHPQVKVACALAQAFVQMIRNRNASALQPWLEEAGGVVSRNCEPLPQALSATRLL
jgi:hypothetical protein